MTPDLILTLEEANRLKSRRRATRWDAVASEFGDAVWPEIDPSFRIRTQDVVFTIGSCFARHIERHLQAVGCKVPALNFRLPEREWNGTPTGPLNHFHPPSFRQSLAWAAAIHDRDGVARWEDCEPLAFDCGDGRYMDLDLVGVAEVERERFVARRQQLYDVLASAFHADVMAMTPGLIEAWLDRKTGRYIAGAPTHRRMLRDRDRWEFHQLSHEQCLADLLAAIDIVRARNPRVKVLITTSPVPLGATFTGQDIRVANAYSKAVLRAACGLAVRQRPLTDYFPSFESATLSPADDVWKTDRLHVRRAFVGRIVSHLMWAYMPDADRRAVARQEAMVLLQDGQFAEAEAAARAIIAQDKGDVGAREILAQALYMKKDAWAEAEVQLRWLVKRLPARADLMTMLGRAIGRHDRSRMDEAFGWIEAAAAAPAGVFKEKAVSFVVENAPPEQAEAVLRRILAARPLYVHTHRYLARALLLQGRAEAALDVLREAAALPKTGFLAAGDLAELLLQQGLAREAADALATGVIGTITEPRIEALRARARAELDPPAEPA